MRDMAVSNGKDHDTVSDRLESLEAHNRDNPPQHPMDPAVKWLFGIIATLITSGCVLWLTSVNASINDLQKTETDHGQKIADIQGQLPHVTKQLDRIEIKLDRLIETDITRTTKEKNP